MLSERIREIINNRRLKPSGQVEEIRDLLDEDEEIENEELDDEEDEDDDEP